MAVVPASDTVVIRTIAQSRGNRLARLLGLVLAPTLVGVLALTAVLAFILTNRLPLLTLAVIAASALSFLIAWRGPYSPASSFPSLWCVLGVIILICGLQAIHISERGLDILSICLFGCYIIIVALTGVLTSIRTMWGVLGLLIGVTLLLTLWLPAQPLALDGTGLTTLAIVLGLQILAAGLYVASATLYDTSLSELGSIRESFERLKTLDQLKDQFITHVNHEMRNPLMALLNYLEVLRMGDERLTSPQRLAMVGQAVQIGKRLSTLMNDVLDVRRIESDQTPVEITTIPLLPLVQEASNLLDPHLSKGVERDLTITIDPAETARGDRTLLLEVIVNLLSNALKYSDPGTPVQVIAGHPDAIHVEIRVIDKGFGIPPEEASMLFERFVRLPRDLASTTYGTGLGLYLCRVFLTRMQGKIRVESSGIAGEGSTFIVTLPTA